VTLPASLGLLLTLASGQSAEPAEAMSRARKAYELVRAGQEEQAIAELTEAARIAPRNALYRSALGGIYERQGRMEPAILEFAEAVRLDPSNQKLSERLENLSLEWGAQLAKERRFRAGLAHAKLTAARFPKSAPAHIMLGLFETRNQQNVAAVQAYQRALELDPTSEHASVGLGIAQTSAGLTKEAAATFRQGLQQFPHSATHREAYGVLLVKLAESGEATADEAIRMLHEALALDASRAEAHYQLGSLALVRDDANEALTQFASAAKNGLDDSRLHYAMARALRRIGKREEAARQVGLFEQRKRVEESVQ
jgi:Flp pilus assembly protein TadD